MSSALIGFSGFIGSNLNNQYKFQYNYNSKNIVSIENKEFDLIVMAAGSSLRWKINQQPQSDLDNLKILMTALGRVKAKEFILISTVDVYPNPVSVTEDSPITINKQNHYGKHRYELENFIKDHFEKSLIIRVPQTFAHGLKKNFIYDLLNSNALDFTHKNSSFQWYNIDLLWQDILVARKNNISLLNLAVEPISCHDVAKYVFNIDFNNITDNPPLHYDVHTKHGNLYNSNSNYIYQRHETIEMLKDFVRKEKKV